MPRSGPTYSELQARDAVLVSRSYAETLRTLGMCATGGGSRVLKKRISIWGISTDHFDPDAARNAGLKQAPKRLEELLVEGSAGSRGNLKRRLFAKGVKSRVCEMCGQDEIWRGRKMSLILDHVNGVSTDNRLANLRIVCPNCAATLETHCGRKLRVADRQRLCKRCGKSYEPYARLQQYCSRECGQRWPRTGKPVHVTRRVERPPHDQLRREIAESGYSAVGRRYGVSDNAIRKWIRSYEREDRAA